MLCRSELQIVGLDTVVPAMVGYHREFGWGFSCGCPVALNDPDIAIQVVGYDPDHYADDLLCELVAIIAGICAELGLVVVSAEVCTVGDNDTRSFAKTVSSSWVQTL